LRGSRIVRVGAKHAACPVVAGQHLEQVVTRDPGGADEGLVDHAAKPVKPGLVRAQRVDMNKWRRGSPNVLV
jgi:hypothetical protein